MTRTTKRRLVQVLTYNGGLSMGATHWGEIGTRYYLYVSGASLFFARKHPGEEYLDVIQKTIKEYGKTDRNHTWLSIPATWLYEGLGCQPGDSLAIYVEPDGTLSANLATVKEKSRFITEKRSPAQNGLIREGFHLYLTKAQKEILGVRSRHDKIKVTVDMVHGHGSIRLSKIDQNVANNMYTMRDIFHNEGREVVYRRVVEYATKYGYSFFITSAFVQANRLKIGEVLNITENDDSILIQRPIRHCSYCNKAITANDSSYPGIACPACAAKV